MSTSWVQELKAHAIIHTAATSAAYLSGSRQDLAPQFAATHVEIDLPLEPSTSIGASHVLA